MTAMVFMKFEYGEMSKYEKALEVLSDSGDNSDNNTPEGGKVIEGLNA